MTELVDQPWRRSWRADPRALPLADAHHNRQSPGSSQLVSTLLAEGVQPTTKKW